MVPLYVSYLQEGLLPVACLAVVPLYVVLVVCFLEPLHVEYVLWDELLLACYLNVLYIAWLLVAGLLNISKALRFQLLFV